MTRHDRALEAVRSTSSPRLSVIIVSWNSGPWLVPCIESLTRQTWIDFEAIIWDNASGDETLAILDQIERADPQVRIERCSDNLGFAAGNNRAARLARGRDFLLTLNPDAALAPECLATMVAAIEARPDVAAVGATQLNGDGSKTDGLGDVLHVSGLAWREACGKLPAPLVPAVREIFSPCAAVALYRRSAFEVAGGFDEDFFCYFEDVDLGFRLQLAGWRCIHATGAFAWHEGSVSVGVESDFALYHGHRNLVWSYFKNMPPLLLWCCLPLHLALNTLTLWVYVRRRRAKPLWQAKRDAVRGLPAIWRKRRQVQRQRQASTLRIWRVLDKRLTGPR